MKVMPSLSSSAPCWLDKATVTFRLCNQLWLFSQSSVQTLCSETMSVNASSALFLLVTPPAPSLTNRIVVTVVHCCSFCLMIIVFLTDMKLIVVNLKAQNNEKYISDDLHVTLDEVQQQFYGYVCH